MEQWPFQVARELDWFPNGQPTGEWPRADPARGVWEGHTPPGPAWSGLLGLPALALTPPHPTCPNSRREVLLQTGHGRQGGGGRAGGLSAQVIRLAIKERCRSQRHCWNIPASAICPLTGREAASGSEFTRQWQESKAPSRWWLKWSES